MPLRRSPQQTIINLSPQAREIRRGLSAPAQRCSVLDRLPSETIADLVDRASGPLITVEERAHRALARVEEAAMASPRIAKSLAVLRSQINAMA